MAGIDLQVKGSLHTLVCNSTGSPATSVLWTFNDEPISTSLDNSLHISESKVVVDRQKSTYSSLLSIIGNFEDIVGLYSCQVRNPLGTSNRVTKAIKGELVSKVCTTILLSGFIQDCISWAMRSH